jgi:putative ABC transport system permease protein
MKHQPPAFAKRILRWFVNAEFVEEVEGDLDELFNERLKKDSLLKATLLYIWDVVRAIRPYHPKRRSTEIGHEILNWIFLKLAFRNLMKRKTLAAINVFGLSLGLVSFFLMMEYVAFDRSYDTFHINADRIYRVAFNWGETDHNGENTSIYASSVPAMGPALKETFAEVEAFTRFIPVLTVKSYCILTYRDKNHVKYSGNADKGFYADSSFLQIFSFPQLIGGVNPLMEPKSIALTMSYAKRIFGDIPLEKIIGSSIEVDAERKETHVITAILEDVPANSHIKFDYLISYTTINSDRLEGNLGWSQFYTYVRTNQPLAMESMDSRFKGLIAKLYGKESRISIFFQPLLDIYLNSKLREEVGTTGSAQQLMFLTIIAYIILFMAWINYVNMFLATAMERVHEIGVKKVLGSTRAHLTVQFFTESLIVNGVSIVLTVLLLVLLQRPFELWLGKNISGILWGRLGFISTILSIVIFGGIVSGLYPAVLLAAKRPVQILGSKFEPSRGGIFFKRGLVYFQFVVSFIIVSGTLIVNRQIDYMKKSDLGMDLTNCVALRSPAGTDLVYSAKVHRLKERLLTHPSIQNVSSTSSIPGTAIKISGGVQRVVGPELDGNNVFFLQVDENFLDTYGIRLITGRNFSRKSSDIPTVILNEAAVRTLKFNSPQDALNHRIHWQRKEFEIIGVFTNYNHLFLKEGFEPIILNYNQTPSGYITLKINGQNPEQALAYVKKEMLSLFPDAPFDYQFLESSFNYQYHSIQQFEYLTKYFAFLAITVACLGLFALSYYVAQARVKEIAVRKVFGAHLYDVLILLSKNYIVISLFSSIIGSCIAFVIMDEWLQNFAFAIELGIWDFLLPMMIITFVVFVTVCYNCFRASSINPSHSLKQT